MDGMMNNHDMGRMMSPPSSSPSMPRKHKMMMMHMTFYWGDEAEILFSGWPGPRTGMYVLSLFLVFLLAGLVEWLSRSRFAVDKNDVVSGLLRTVLHALRMGLAYLVMLAVMSFNLGIFIAAVLGHALGFFVFGSRIFGSGRDKGLVGELEQSHGYKRSSDLGPMSC